MTSPEKTAARTGNGQRRRTELAAFLRSRRARITPADVGMPPGPRRRTPGLRREEVAQLAGVGVTWYTWLEQGRPINASTQVLEAVARTLQLDAAERAHFYRLAEVQAPPAPVRADTLPPDIRTILHSMDPLPAAVVSARSDLLVWNRSYATLFPMLVNAPAAERNSLWWVFTAPSCCNPIVNFGEQAPEHVAIFRYRYTQHRDEPGWEEFAQRLCAASPEFARLWARHDVANPRPCNKVFRYPSVGEIATRTTSMDVTGARGARLVASTPIDDESRDRIAWLLDHPDAAVPDHSH